MLNLLFNWRERDSSPDVHSSLHDYRSVKHLVFLFLKMNNNSVCHPRLAFEVTYSPELRAVP